MKYVIGIDSGGTKYLLKAADLNGRALAVWQGEPASPHRMDGQALLERIGRHVDACLAGFGGRREECAMLVCGTTGIDSPEDARTLTKVYESLSGFDCPVLCVNDAQVAHQAATGGVGVVVIAGTGSVAYGRNEAGRETRSGGWPLCIFGDEGSGSWIAAQALRHVARVLDGELPAGPLWNEVQKRLAIPTPAALIGVCQQLEAAQFTDPGLALAVNEAAALGDAVAEDILTRAAMEAFSLADAVSRKLGYTECDAFTVGVWGSAVVKSPRMLGAFQSEVLRNYPKARVRIADGDAADGAVQIALARLAKEDGR